MSVRRLNGSQSKDARREIGDALKRAFLVFQSPLPTDLLAELEEQSAKRQSSSGPP